MSRFQSRTDIDVEIENSSKCAKCCKFTWKTITCIFSHVALITLVVSYCAAGAFTFEALEVEHEKEIKRSIAGIRNNVSNHLWQLALESKVLDQTNFTRNASALIKNFEGALVKAMTKDGWDGEENENIVQWTRTGSLFYSIIVITTIGYGHIAPKTPLGKVVTIFYAILGIPLMLICLSNIGDIMATSFRFLYWRVCCYVCTRPKKPRKSRSLRSSVKSTERYSRSKNHSFRRSMRVSTRSVDTALKHSETLPSYHSDTDLRLETDFRSSTRRGQSMPRMRSSQSSKYSDTPVSRKQNIYSQRGGSLDRKKIQNMQGRTNFVELELLAFDKTPILCNKYVLKEDELLANNIPGFTQRETEKHRNNAGNKKMDYLQPPDSSEYDNQRRSLRDSKKKKSPVRQNPSPKMMTPLGYGHRSKYLDDPESDDEDYYGDVYYDVEKQRTRPVPIGLCVFLVVSYIIGGAFLFDYWEGWGLLNAAYFCFITLTTIGFGDLVPAKGVTKDSTLETTTSVTISIALCSLYLLFGISLLAMSFNLVQEEVIENMRSIAKTLGIIKSDEDDSEDEEV